MTLETAMLLKCYADLLIADAMSKLALHACEDKETFLRLVKHREHMASKLWPELLARLHPPAAIEPSMEVH